MKVGIDINIPQSETVGTLELETNTKKEVKKLKEMEDQATEGKEDKKKLFKWEWKLWVKILNLLEKNLKKSKNV